MAGLVLGFCGRAVRPLHLSFWFSAAILVLPFTFRSSLFPTISFAENTEALAEGAGEDTAPLVPDGTSEEVRTLPEGNPGEQLALPNHQVTISPYPGLPSKITVLRVPESVLEMRALLVLDGALAVLPLRLTADAGNLEVSFPTPRDTLSYQFQVVSKRGAGEAWMSEMYAVDPKCVEVSSETALSAANHFPSQAELLKKAVELDKEVETLKYVLTSINSLLGKEE